MPANEWKPGCPEWIHDVENARALAQRKRVLLRIVSDDCQEAPAPDLARKWHRAVFEGLVPDPDYLGNFRDVEESPWCLQGYDVGVGDARGVPYDRVLGALGRFFEEFSSGVTRLDTAWASLRGPYSETDVDLVVDLAAWVHGEWVRIHPFANGNGRTARLWANYVFCRYGFGPCVIVRPRPEEPYGKAARQSMKHGNHDLMKALFWELVKRNLQDWAMGE